MRSVERSFTTAGPAAQAAAVACTLLGAPLDRTESFRTGAADGPAAIRELSDSLETYSPEAGRDLEDLVLADLGDLDFDGLDLEDAVEAVAASVEHAASQGGLVVVFGGEHTISLGGFRGVRAVHSDAALVQLDAHLDLREHYEGRRLSHATWAYQAGLELGFDSIVQLGVRSGAREEWPVARQLLRWSDRALVLPPDVHGWLLERPVYLTIDIDVLDPAAAPGTGCPEPGGASFQEVFGVLDALRDAHVVAVDIVEVAPRLDPAGITAAAAAKLAREAILLFAPDRTGEAR